MFTSSRSILSSTIVSFLLFVSLKRSNDYFRQYISDVSGNDGTVSQPHLRQRARRNFTLLPDEFYVKDLDLLKKQYNNNLKAQNTESSMPKVGTSEKNIEKEPIHVTLLIDRYRNRFKNRGRSRNNKNIDIESSKILKEIEDSLVQDVILQSNTYVEPSQEVRGQSNASESILYNTSEQEIIKDETVEKNDLINQFHAGVQTISNTYFEISDQEREQSNETESTVRNTTEPESIENEAFEKKSLFNRFHEEVQAISNTYLELYEQEQEQLNEDESIIYNRIEPESIEDESAEENASISRYHQTEQNLSQEPNATESVMYNISEPESIAYESLERHVFTSPLNPALQYVPQEQNMAGALPTLEQHNTSVSNNEDEIYEQWDPSAIQESDANQILNWDNDTLQAIENGDIVHATVNISGLLGRIEDNRLVVDVDEKYAFWFGGQTRLCNLLREMTLLKYETNRNFTGLPMPRPLLNMTLNCVEMKKDQNFGQGNWITALYTVRLAAARYQVDHQIQCSDGRESEMTLLLPWFGGYQEAPETIDPWPFSGELPTEEEACTDRYPMIRVDKVANLVIDDIQRMAVMLVGTRDEIRRHPLIPENQEPMIPNVTLDDVAIHFRCGDVMGGAKRNDFGMIKFSEYKKWISPETRTVGILTQPFAKEMNRGRDAGKVDACKRATYALVDTLQDFLPNATISIHNSIDETLPLTYARIAMANQSFTSLSSFGIFPVMGTFGQGYFQQGNRGVNPFSQYLPNYFPNLHEMNAPKLGTGIMYNMEVDDILKWLTAP